MYKLFEDNFKIKNILTSQILNMKHQDNTIGDLILTDLDMIVVTINNYLEKNNYPFRFAVKGGLAIRYWVNIFKDYIKDNFLLKEIDIVLNTVSDYDISLIVINELEMKEMEVDKELFKETIKKVFNDINRFIKENEIIKKLSINITNMIKNSLLSKYKNGLIPLEDLNIFISKNDIKTHTNSNNSKLFLNINNFSLKNYFNENIDKFILLRIIGEFNILYFENNNYNYITNNDKKYVINLEILDISSEYNYTNILIDSSLGFINPLKNIYILNFISLLYNMIHIISENNFLKLKKRCIRLALLFKIYLFIIYNIDFYENYHKDQISLFRYLLNNEKIIVNNFRKNISNCIKIDIDDTLYFEDFCEIYINNIKNYSFSESE